MKNKIKNTCPYLDIGLLETYENKTITILMWKCKLCFCVYIY